MFKRLWLRPGNNTQKKKQLWEREFSIVRNGLDEKEVIAFVDQLRAQRNSSDPVPAESLRSFIDRMITDAEQIAAGIKIKAEAEAQEEAVRIIDQAKQGAADIRKSVEAAAEKEAGEIFSALNSKTDITEEGARKKAQLYLLKARGEIEKEVREEYRRTHSRLLYSLLSTTKDGAVSGEAPAPLPDEAEPEKAVTDKATKKAARAEEKSRAKEAKKALTAQKQAEKEAKQAAKTRAKDIAAPTGNIAQQDKPAAAETEPVTGESAPGEIPAQVTEAVRESDIQQPVVPVAELDDGSPPESGEPVAEKIIEQAAPPDTKESAPEERMESVNQTAVEEPVADEGEVQPEGLEPITEEQASGQTTEEATLTEADKPVSAQTGEEAIRPESNELTLEQMVEQVARQEGDEAVMQPSQEQPAADEPAVAEEPAKPLPTLDTKALFSGGVELAISVPVDPVAVSKLYNQLQSTPDIKILYTRGSWDRGTTITVSLDKPLPLIGIISDISGIKISPDYPRGENSTKSGSLLGATRKGVTRINLSIREG